MKKIVVTLSLIFLFMTPATAAAAERAVRVSYPAPTATQLPLWAAKEAKFFDKHGVNVDLVFVGSSSIAIAALFSGQLDIVVGGAIGGIASYLQGYRDLALFGSLNNRLNFFVYAHPPIAATSATAAVSRVRSYLCSSRSPSRCSKLYMCPSSWWSGKTRSNARSAILTLPARNMKPPSSCC